MARKRNRRMKRSQLSCTCDLRFDTNPPKYADHDGHCDLWHIEDFMNGLLDWDPIAQKLYRTGLAGDWGGDDLPAGDTTDMQRIIDRTVTGYVKGDAARVPGYSYLDWGYLSCRHNMTKVVLPDAEGTVVHCSASTDVRGRFNRPEWGVYLSHSWTAQSLAVMVPWQDYGTPTVPWAGVREVIEDFYRRAKAGLTVEVGCMGGHGRTGTFLAAVVMLADPNMTPEGAVAWVRKNYCEKAVEDLSQHYFLSWFDDPTLPPHYTPPVTKASPAKGGTTAATSSPMAPVKVTGSAATGGLVANGPMTMCPACDGNRNLGADCPLCMGWRVVDVEAADGWLLAQPPTVTKPEVTSK